MGINRASGSKRFGILAGANRLHIAAALLASLALLPAAPALAAGEVLITHAKANAGNVTPGDTAGYPVTISIPGTFQLASNLFVAANKIGIQVTSKNVTIDLNGFTLQGSDVAWYGITGGLNSVTIESGTIEQFKFDGINGGSAKYWVVDNVRIIENGRDGLSVGSYAQVRSSVAVDNGGRGIATGSFGVIQGNNASDNATIGIQTYRSGVVGNTIISNGTYGLGGYDYTGYGLNTLLANGQGTGQNAVGVLPAHPNACFDCP